MFEAVKHCTLLSQMKHEKIDKKTFALYLVKLIHRIYRNNTIWKITKHAN